MMGNKRNKKEEIKQNNNRTEGAAGALEKELEGVSSDTAADAQDLETVSSEKDTNNAETVSSEKDAGNAEIKESVYDALYANKADSVYGKNTKQNTKSYKESKKDNTDRTKYNNIDNNNVDGFNKDTTENSKDDIEEGNPVIEDKTIYSEEDIQDGNDSTKSNSKNTKRKAGKEKKTAAKKNNAVEMTAEPKETKKQAVKQPETENEKHRKRIKRLKNFILIMVFLFFLIPTVFCVINYFHIQSLEKQIDNLNQRMETILQYMETNSETKVTEEVPFEETMASVSVNVPEEMQNDEKEGKKKVCLTFDDGPSTNTDAILDVLAEYDVKATFFVTGKKSYTEQYRHIVEQGHTIGMHSYQHKYDVIYQDLPTFAEDFYAVRDYIKEITGVDCKYYRFPGGSSNQVSQIDMLQCIAFLEEQGVDYVDWNISSEDAAGAQTAEEVVENVIGQIKNSKAETMVILMHDLGSKTATVEALPLIIETIQDMDGYTLVPMDEDVNLVQHLSLAEEEREEVMEEMHKALEAE